MAHRCCADGCGIAAGHAVSAAARRAQTAPPGVVDSTVDAVVEALWLVDASAHATGMRRICRPVLAPAGGASGVQALVATEARQHTAPATRPG